MTDPFVSAACRALSALDPPRRLLLAVSGGADSVAMLDALWRGRKRRDMQALEFVIGHFDHRMRSDSARDRDLVAALAKERELRFVHADLTPLPLVAAPSPATRRLAGEGTRTKIDQRSLTLPQRAERVTGEGTATNGSGVRSGGIEERLRDARYRALEEMARDQLCGAIVLAHTATDQAETLLLRLIRGAGARGLAAMRPKAQIGQSLRIRPLLSVTREETRAYCRRHELEFHDDPTNENQLPRARIRLEVLPVLERLAPGAVRRMAEASARIAADEDLLVAATPTGDDASYIARQREPIRRRMLTQWVEQTMGTRRRLSAAHIVALEALVRTRRGAVDLPAGRNFRLIAEVVDGRLAARRTSDTLGVACRAASRYAAKMREESGSLDGSTSGTETNVTMTPGNRKQGRTR